MAKDSARRTKTLLGVAVAIVSVLLVTLQLITFVEERATQRRIELVQSDALVSVRLVGRLAADVMRERNLIDRHVYERATINVAAIRRQIDDVRADFGMTASRYAELPMLPGEASSWYKLMSDVASVQLGVRPVLVLSAAHRDAEAIARLRALTPAFDQIRADATALLDIEQRDAEDTVAQTSRIHRAALRLRLTLVAAIFLLVVIGGVRMTAAVVRAQRELQVANEELEARNRELDAFAGRVAHDLRGPLTTMRLATSQLDGVPEARRVAATLGRGITRISGLIEDLLVLSRIGGTPGASTELAPVESALQDELGRMVRQTGGSLRVELAPARVACSEELLRQCLWNLGENAVKYRRPDVPLEIAILGKPDGTCYVIRVSDNGVGIPPEDLRRVFEPFFRGSRTASIPGTGLGLAIVRRVVEVHGGKVTVESTPDVGTTFVISLALAPAPEAAAGHEPRPAT